MTTEKAAVDSGVVRELVDRAVKAATPAEDMAERKIRPESTITFREPTPLAGFRAAQQVARLAEEEMHKYATRLRSEGTSWRELADMMRIPYSDDYSRPERAFELVAGPDSGSTWSGPRIYWHCAGPLGCGQYITDRGPYNGHPSDNEDGHAGGCRRLAAEGEAYERESEERERRWRIMDEAYAQLEPHGFAQQTADRARWVAAHGGQYKGWSTSECLAVALVLDDDEALERHGYSRRTEAIQRVLDGMSYPPANAAAWLALVRAAATGDRR